MLLNLGDGFDSRKFAFVFWLHFASISRNFEVLLLLRSIFGSVSRKLLLLLFPLLEENKLEAVVLLFVVSNCAGELKFLGFLEKILFFFFLLLSVILTGSVFCAYKFVLTTNKMQKKKNVQTLNIKIH